MAFDPDKYLSGTPAAFDPDSYLSQDAEPTPTPEERSPLSITPEGLGQSFKSAIGGIGNAANAATGGLLDEIQARIGTGIDSALKYSGELFTDGAPNPYENMTPEELRQQNREMVRGNKAALQEADPIAYGGADLAASVAIPAKGVGSLAGQAIAQTLGRSDAKGKELLEETADSIFSSVAPVTVLNSAFKVGAAIDASKYGKAFKGGEDVQKYVDPNEQRDLANRVSEAIKERVTEARKAHAQARGQFVDNFGQTPVDASDVAQTIQANINRFGPSAKTSAGTFGPLSQREAEDIARYTQALSEPRTAQELYKIWDDIGAKAKYYENTLKSNNTEINRQLQTLQAGIKAKLHELDPQGLQAADEAVSRVSDLSKHLSRGADETGNESFLSTLGNRNRGNRREAFQELLGDNPVAKEVDDFQTFKSFEGQGGSGSIEGAKTIGAAGAGGAIGGAIAGPVGAAIGAAGGAALSRGQNQRALLTGAGEIFKKMGISDAAWTRIPPKYKNLLQQAAQKGGRSLAITHFLLSNEDPEYQRAISQHP